MAAFVAAVGGLARFDRAWIVVVITAAITAVAGARDRQEVARLTAESFDDGRAEVPVGVVEPAGRVVMVGAGIAGLTVLRQPAVRLGPIPTTPS